MLTAENAYKLAALGLFLLPVGAVKVVEATFARSVPAQTMAAVGLQGAQGPSIPAASQPSNDPQAIEGAGAALVGEGDVGWDLNPFYYPPTATAAREASAQAPAERSLPGLAVQMILSQPSGDLAVIDGQSYRVGEQVDQTSYRLVSVDSQHRSATLEDVQSGKTLVLQVELRRP